MEGKERDMTRLDGAFTLLDAYSNARKAARIFDMAGDTEMAEDSRVLAEAISIMAEAAANRG
jgi:hypothetical protein